LTGKWYGSDQTSSVQETDKKGSISLVVKEDCTIGDVAKAEKPGSDGSDDNDNTVMIIVIVILVIGAIIAAGFMYKKKKGQNNNAIDPYE